MTAQEDKTREEIVAEAEAAVQTAEAAVAEAQSAVDGYKPTKAETAEALRAAKKNLKAAKDYIKTLTDETPEDDRNTAAETETGWQAEVDRLTALVEENKAAEKEAREQLKSAKAELRDAKKVLSGAKKTPKPKVERVEQNGIKKPIDGGPSNIVWDAADKAQAELGRVPGLGDILQTCLDAGVKDATTKAAYAHWRKFHGITGRVESEAQRQAREAKEAEKAAKAEEAAAKKAAKASEEPAPAPEA